MHWSKWKPVDQILNKHYFWTNETFVKCSAQENKRRHVTHFYLLCCFSIWSLCINIEVSKDYKVDFWICQLSRDCPPFPVCQPNLTIPETGSHVCSFRLPCLLIISDFGLICLWRLKCFVNIGRCWGETSHRDKPYIGFLLNIILADLFCRLSVYCTSLYR